VWGSASGNGRFTLSDGRWSAVVDYREHIPLLTPGIYTVAVYGYSYILTFDYLTVEQ